MFATSNIIRKLKHLYTTYIELGCKVVSRKTNLANKTCPNTSPFCSTKCFTCMLTPHQLTSTSFHMLVIPHLHKLALINYSQLLQMARHSSITHNQLRRITSHSIIAVCTINIPKRATTTPGRGTNVPTSQPNP